jgi:hypothetical protein
MNLRQYIQQLENECQITYEEWNCGARFDSDEAASADYDKFYAVLSAKQEILDSLLQLEESK